MKSSQYWSIANGRSFKQQHIVNPHLSAFNAYNMVDDGANAMMIVSLQWWWCQCNDGDDDVIAMMAMIMVPMQWGWCHCNNDGNDINAMYCATQQ